MIAYPTLFGSDEAPTTAMERMARSWSVSAGLSSETTGAGASSTYTRASTAHPPFSYSTSGLRSNSTTRGLEKNHRAAAAIAATNACSSRAGWFRYPWMRR